MHATVHRDISAVSGTALTAAKKIEYGDQRRFQ